MNYTTCCSRGEGSWDVKYVKSGFLNPVGRFSTTNGNVFFILESLEEVLHVLGVEEDLTYHFKVSPIYSFTYGNPKGKI